jgi:hypothetical protein
VEEEKAGVLTKALSKVLDRMETAYEDMEEINSDFETYLACLSLNVQELVRTIPFDLLLEKFDILNKEAHIAHLEKCGIAYLDALKINRFIRKQYNLFADETLITKTIFIRTVDI